MEKLVELVMQAKKLVDWDMYVRINEPPTYGPEVFITSKITFDEVVNALGGEVQTTPRKTEEYPYEHSFRFGGVKFYMISEEEKYAKNSEETGS